MKNAAIILGLALMLLPVSASVRAAPPVTPYLSIAAQPPVVQSGQDVRVDVNITNRSNETIPMAVAVGKGTAEFDYDIAVTRQDRRPVERTEYGRSLVGAGTHSVRVSKQLINLKPGQSYSDYFMLNKVFDVSRPGTYLVRVEREPVPGQNATARSSAITIVVQ